MKIIVKSLSINGTYLMLIPWKYILKTSKTLEVLVFLLDCRWYLLPVHTFLMKSFCRLADSTRHRQTAFPAKVFMTCWDFYSTHLNAWNLKAWYLEIDIKKNKKTQRQEDKKTKGQKDKKKDKKTGR